LCQPFHLSLFSFQASYSPFLPTFFLCVASFLTCCTLHDLGLPFGRFYFSFIFKISLVPIFIFKTCPYHILCYLLIYLPHLRMLLDSNNLELNLPGNGLMCIAR
jgi:hypothetical protein